MHIVKCGNAAAGRPSDGQGGNLSLDGRRLQRRQLDLKLHRNLVAFVPARKSRVRLPCGQWRAEGAEIWRENGRKARLGEGGARVQGRQLEEPLFRPPASPLFHPFLPLSPSPLFHPTALSLSLRSRYPSSGFVLSVRSLSLFFCSLMFSRSPFSFILDVCPLLLCSHCKYNYFPTFPFSLPHLPSPRVMFLPSSDYFPFTFTTSISFSIFNHLIHCIIFIIRPLLFIHIHSFLSCDIKCSLLTI